MARRRGSEISGDGGGSAPGRDASELDRAVAKARAAEPRQVALFEEAAAAPEPAPQSKGRPAGSRNRRSERYAALLMREEGDPLKVASKVAATDVTDRQKLQALADTWGCTRYEAVKLWATVNRDVQPYLHQQLPRAVILNPGDPAGEAVLVKGVIDGEFRRIDNEENQGDSDDGDEPL